MRLLSLCLLLVAAVSTAEDPPIKLIGDEVSLTKIKAAPRDWLDRPFILTGGIEINDYYNYGYRDLERTHYSLAFRQIVSDPPRVMGENCDVYLPRDTVAKSVVEQIIKTTEANKLKRVRIKVVLNSRRYENGAWNMFDLLDVQFATADGRNWQPWEFEPLRKKEAEAAELRELTARVKALTTEAEKRKAEEEKRKATADRIAADMRVWTSANGKFTVKAKYAGIVNGMVRLKKSDGTTIEVREDELSKADQEWLKTRLARK